MSEVFQSEEKVAAVLGVTRATLRSIRKRVMVSEVDYSMEYGRMSLSPAGVKKAMLELGLDNVAGAATYVDSSEPLAEKTAAAAETITEPVTVELVARRMPANCRIVLCDPPGVETPGPVRLLVRVQVHNSKNIIPGMRLPCRHVQDDLYTLARACPRWRGVW